MASYQPMTVADLAEHLSQTPDEKTRWKTFWEFLEEYRWESSDAQTALLMDDPPPPQWPSLTLERAGAAMHRT